MPRTIRKHPFSFLYCLGWLIAGFCMGYVMHHESSDYYNVPFADTVVILSFVGTALIILCPVIGLIVKWLRRPALAVRQERSQRRAFAKWFESTQPGFGWYTLLIVLAVVLPFMAFISVIWLDRYMPAALFVSIGIAVWLCFECYEWNENRLLKEPDDPNRFHLQRDSSHSLLEELYEQSSTFGMPMSLWEGRRVYLYNALLQQGVADDRSTITGYVFSLADLEKHFNSPQQPPLTDEVVWIPLNQFYGTMEGKSRAAIQKLFPYCLTTLVDRRYETNRETDPSQYPYSSVDVRLQPDADATLCDIDHQLHLFTASATNPDSESDWYYHGCMLRIEGAELADVKWDSFETAGDPDDDREHYLSPEEAQTLYRLILQKAFTYEICSLTYLEEKRQLALEIWTEPEDPDGLPLKGEAASFALDDGLAYLLLLSYDQLRWHWMKATSMENPYLFI